MTIADLLHDQRRQSLGRLVDHDQLRRTARRPGYRRGLLLFEHREFELNQ
jgi:hypothetical protein